MKSYKEIFGLILFVLLGFSLVLLLFETRSHQNYKYGYYGMVLSFLMVFVLSNFFPKLKKMEVGTIKFFPNLLKFLFSKFKN